MDIFYRLLLGKYTGFPNSIGCSAFEFGAIGGWISKKGSPRCRVPAQKFDFARQTEAKLLSSLLL
jgi:hypothetical protein